jgi:hypothetical protein
MVEPPVPYLDSTVPTTACEVAALLLLVMPYLFVHLPFLTNANSSSTGSPDFDFSLNHIKAIRLNVVVDEQCQSQSSTSINLFTNRRAKGGCHRT